MTSIPKKILQWWRNTPEHTARKIRRQALKDLKKIAKYQKAQNESRR